MDTGVSIETIKQRYSCRSYTGDPLSVGDRSRLEEILGRRIRSPFGTVPRFTLIAADAGDSESLKGLGTYGFISRPAAFIVGSVEESDMYLEDFGYCMERIILEATAMGLGTCWLGGTFKRSRFAEKAGITGSTEIPAVTATGYMTDRRTVKEKIIRSVAGSDKRKNRDELFFDHNMQPLNDEFFRKGYGTVLEMLRIAPSASNKQPWRIVHDSTGRKFHFYLERTKNYDKNRFLKSDLQRVDMGIAMCHFETAAELLGLKGSWEKSGGSDVKSDASWEYTVSWRAE